MSAKRTLHLATAAAGWLSRVAVAILATNVAAMTALAHSPKYNHILIVMMENHSFDQIFSGGDAPYLRSLAKDGAVFTKSYAVAHPSQPNYFALFSGSTQGVKDDNRHDLEGPNLATELAAAGKRFVGYVEAGSPRKHNPWESFADAKAVEQPFTVFPTDFALLPAVGFVIPNLSNDMHDGPVKRADAWLRQHLDSYANWAKSNNSLLIVTFDEDDSHSGNRIFTLFYGAGVKPGQYGTKIDHYNVLRTVEDIEGLAPLGVTAQRAVIAGIWRAL
jgi:acid phosphatase